jgi:hypothetical protein
MYHKPCHTHYQQNLSLTLPLNLDTNTTIKEEFEDTHRVIRIRKMTKNRQHKQVLMVVLVASFDGSVRQVLMVVLDKF